MPRDPGKKRIKIAPRLVRRNGVPGFQVSVVFAFFGGLPITDNSVCQRAQAAPVLFRALRDRCFITQQIQFDNPVIVQVLQLLSFRFLRPHPGKHRFDRRGYTFSKKNIKNLPYLAEFNAGYNFVLTINDDWTDFVIKEMLTLTMRGQLRTKEFNIVSKAYNDLKIGSSFEVKELKTISFKPQRICSNCNKAIGENDYQYHCYWCNISFCIKCVEDKIKENTNGRQKYLHTKHNLFYFKTKNENDLKDIDEYKLGKNSFAECSERSLSFCHSAICNGCRGSFPSSAIMCQRYICMTCLPGLYRSGGFVDFDFKCISDLRDKKGNFNNINRNNENHDDEHHVYLMLICQVGSYKDY